MGRAKQIEVRPITAKSANDMVRILHYSGKVVQNSRLHLGVFMNGRCGGVMSFGPSMDIRRVGGLVAGTGWNDFMELNRMAFADWLPKNSESRALGVAFRLIKKHYPHIKWIISFADATQCGDGTIYRASGFVLTGIKKNSQIMRLSDGTIISKKTLDNHVEEGGKYGSALARQNGGEYLPGFQIRYVKFLDETFRARLTVPELPYSAIAECGASMYKGKQMRPNGAKSADQVDSGGSTPTRTLHTLGGE